VYTVTVFDKTTRQYIEVLDLVLSCKVLVLKKVLFTSLHQQQLQS